MQQNHSPGDEIYELLGYLAHPQVDLLYDVQAPPKKREEFESQYQNLTGEPICPPGPGSRGYSVLGESVDKRSVQYRFSYTPAGSVPLQLKKMSRQATGAKKRISNKALVLEMFRHGFVFGSRPQRDKIVSTIDPRHRVRFEFGYAVATIEKKPLDFKEFESGFSVVETQLAAEFSLFDEAPPKTVVSARAGRLAAFRHHVLKAYENQCCLCSGSLVDPTGVYETEAAHIVPKRLLGSDDVRNGLALCRKHHWAYDRGMFGIEDDYSVLIPAGVSALPDNNSLKRFHHRRIAIPANPAFAPALSALEWHRKNILAG